MMRGKDDLKMRGPMFPRLHVNDTEKGGPKAPPRNKMALYEQLSIPSQRPTHSSATNSVPPPSQGNSGERGMFFSYQRPTRHQSEKQYCHYSGLNTPSTQVEQRKKSDEDDFRVPIFFHPSPNQECSDYTSDLDRRRISPSNPSYFNRPLKIRKAEKVGMLECDTVQEGKSQKEESSKEDKFVSNSLTIEKKDEDLKKQTDLSLRHGSRDSPGYSIERIHTNGSIEPELCAESQPARKRCSTTVVDENIAALEKRNSSTCMRDFMSEGLRETELQNKSFKSLQMRNVLEKGESLSEASVMDSVVGVDVTPDDVVGMIGQKHFWKARRAIVNQQRVFTVQVFELHRLIKVQKSIAASPHLLLEDPPYLIKPIKNPPSRKVPLYYPIKAISNISKEKGEPEKPSHTKESSAENIVRKESFASAPIQNCMPRSSCKPPSGNSPAPSSISSNGNASPWCFNQPQGHQWLIPVMSPSEGLVYKPYPGPGFMGPQGGPTGTNPPSGDFLPPTYGVPPLPQHPQYRHQMPAFPPQAAAAHHHHAYFPPYGAPPVMSGPAFSGSSVEQVNREADVGIRREDLSPLPSHKKQASADSLSELNISEDHIEVQGSSPVQDSSDKERRNVLQLFPTGPATDEHHSSPRPPKLDSRPQVIKVVPHNARSATESAARIFQSIQEGRKQYDAL